MPPKRPHLPRTDGETVKRNKIVDPYCWLCHGNDTNINCSKCIRSYHSTCISLKSAIDVSTFKYKCNTCIKMDVAASEYSKRRENVETVNGLLKHVTKRLEEDVEFVRFIDFFEENETKVSDAGLVNVFGLEYTRTKVESAGYKTTLEHLNDIRWIRHNVSVIANCPEILRMVKRLEKFCIKEVYDIEMCAKCFDASNTEENWFAQVCSPPHILVWARESGHRPYKPAKVIGSTSETKIDIRFFGDHDRALVPPTNCYLYSKQNPNHRSDDKTRMELIKSLEEVDMYIKNIQRKHGSFLITSEPKIEFNVKKIAKYLSNLIPGLELPPNYTLKRKPNYLAIRNTCSKTPSVNRSNVISKASVQPKRELRLVIERVETIARLQKYLHRSDSEPNEMDCDLVSEHQSEAEHPEIDDNVSEAITDDNMTETSNTQLIGIFIEPALADEIPSIVQDISTVEMTSTTSFLDDSETEDIVEETIQSDPQLMTMDEIPADEDENLIDRIYEQQQEEALNVSDLLDNGYEIELNDMVPLAQSTPFKAIGSNKHYDTAHTLVAENNDTDIAALQAKLDDLQQRYEQSKVTIESLEVQVARSTSELEAEKKENARLMADIDKAIEETKNKIWCTICKNEIKIRNSCTLYYPVCRKQCLIALWAKSTEAETDLNDPPEIANNETSAVDTHMATQLWIDQLQNSQPLTPDTEVEGDHEDLMENFLRNC
ncbi:zinc finger MYND domain-containing protein 11-like [Contarinia nasturtii]|uniref:zinc finger MYND domain-containing protein 11-like n=1 Tax=Contarinia nasturtii TaxID=265458 RepID=UPI0012D3A50D|nr:zinc finger MYND domain-containing protein 11-like [Contarinia nasturtii]XP_031622722.1 zinc finger MYND domain-containing protein 11-like [Contarinia nasturtii]